MPIVSDAVCEAASSPAVTVENADGTCVTGPASNNGTISSEMVCAGSSCKGFSNGDSGGPLSVKSSSTSQHDLVGVVSNGVGCELYGVYAEVAQLRTWIDATIAANGGATYCSS